MLSRRADENHKKRSHGNGNEEVNKQHRNRQPQHRDSKNPHPAARIQRLETRAESERMIWLHLMLPSQYEFRPKPRQSNDC